MLFAVRRKAVPGAAVLFACPKCGDVTPGNARRFIDTVMLLHVVPVLTVENTYIVCEICGTKLHSPLSLDDVERVRGLQIDEFLSYSPSFVFKFLAATSLLLCWVPIVGSVLAAIALMGTRRFAGWPRTVSKWALVISTIPTVFGITGIVMGW